MLEKAYWNGNGEEQAKYDEMMKADWDDEMTQASKNDMHRYYRYYNDGDLPGWAKGSKGWPLTKLSTLYNQFVLNDAGEQELERRATETILKEWKRYQKSCQKVSV